VLTARDQARLEALAAELKASHGAAVHVMPADLAAPGAATALFDRVQEARLAVDVLVNNAGFGTYGRFSASDIRRELEMLQVNVAALTELTRKFLPGMVVKKRGGVLNVASTAAFQPGPLMAGYYATKAYVVSFSEALANELKGTGVTVTVLCPGPTRTEFQARAGIEETRLMRTRIMDARSVALAGCRGLAAGRALVIPGFRNRLLATLVRWLPRGLVVGAVRRMQESRERA
jgi:short-subunit dehydrogenase